MSAISATPNSTAAVRRPGMVTAAVSIVVVTALAAIANGVIIITGGKELFKQLLENAGLSGLTDADLNVAAQFLGYDSFDGLISTFTMRGYLVGGAGVVLLLCGIGLLKGATWARILGTISAVAVMIFSVVVLADETNGAMAGLAMLAILGGVLSIIFVWLPPVGRYRKALG